VRNKWAWFQQTYPALAEHLEPFQKEAEARNDKGEYWWELRTCDYYSAFEKPKIIYPEICSRPEYGYDAIGSYANNKCFIIPSEDRYLLGLLNSTLTFFYYEMMLPKLRGGFFMPAYVVMRNLPIRPIDPENPDDMEKHDRMVSLVETMLDLHRRLPTAATEHQRRLLEMQVEATDREIDALVYALYNLTPDEIAVVEAAVGKAG